MLAVVAAVVVGGVNIFGGSGTVVGAALGAMFLGFVANALILVGLSQFWLQAIYGVVILVAVSADAIILRRLQRTLTARAARPMTARPATAAAATARATPRRSPAGRRCCSSRSSRLILIGQPSRRSS